MDAHRNTSHTRFHAVALAAQPAFSSSAAERVADDRSAGCLKPMRPSPCLTHRVSFLESRLLQYAVASVHPFELLLLNP